MQPHPVFFIDVFPNSRTGFFCEPFLEVGFQSKERLQLEYWVDLYFSIMDSV
jgi:hypothetical protein